MDDLLFLCHRIPYPPDKGDKIRSHQLLLRLLRRHRVHLGAFVDDPDDWRHVDHLRTLCADGDCRFVGLHPRLARLRALSGLLRGEPLTLPYYREPAMARWVAEIVREKPIRHIVVYSAAPAQFVLDGVPDGVRRLIDFVDVDSAKWQQYAEGRRGFWRWLYRREARTLRDFERRVARRFDRSFFVSPAEADQFRELAPESAGRIDYWVNGVDTDHFSPATAHPNPYGPEERVLLFTGAMDYWANADAVCWFADAVFPAVLEQVPRARFVIAGGRPTAAVRRLGERPGIRVTGRVPDMRPYLAHAWAAVAPLRIAQGIQNKILEAMAMARPVLATGKAMTGIALTPGLERWVADDADGLAQRAITLLGATDGERLRRESGMLGHELVLRGHVWARNLERLDAALGEGEGAERC